LFHSRMFNLRIFTENSFFFGFVIRKDESV